MKTKMILIGWIWDVPIGLTEGKVYEINSDGIFLDDHGRIRYKDEYGTWKEVK